MLQHFVLFYIFASQSLHVNSQGIKYITPVHTEFVPGVVCYTNVAPIIFKYFYPDRSTDNLIATGHRFFSSITGEPYCPVVFHLQQISEHIRTLVTSSPNDGKVTIRITDVGIKEKKMSDCSTPLLLLIHSSVRLCCIWRRPEVLFPWDKWLQWHWLWVFGRL